MSGRALPLEGIRVLDLSRVLAGPLCTMTLADLGANVIKIESVDGDETRHWGPPWLGEESAYYLSINRNKRSVIANFKQAGDIDLIKRLAAEADVVVENFLPGALQRAGIDYETLSNLNPKVIWCTITGYGTGGPSEGEAGYDFAIQARSGWMSINGEPDGDPLKVGVAIVDLLAANSATIAIVAALRERDRSGMGQRAEISLFDCALAGLVNVVQGALVSGDVPKRWGSAHPTIVPYQPFRAADGWIAIAVGNDRQWQSLCTVLAAPELAGDERYSTNPGRLKHRTVLVRAIAKRIRKRTIAELLAALRESGVPCAPVQNVVQALSDPQVTQRGVLWEVAGESFGLSALIASPIRLSSTPPRLRMPPPSLGEHSDQVRQSGWGQNGALPEES